MTNFTRIVCCISYNSKAKIGKLVAQSTWTLDNKESGCIRDHQSLKGCLWKQWHVIRIQEVVVLCQCQNNWFQSHCKTDCFLVVVVVVERLNVPCIVLVTQKLPVFYGNFWVVLSFNTVCHWCRMHVLGKYYKQISLLFVARRVFDKLILWCLCFTNLIVEIFCAFICLMSI